MTLPRVRVRIAAFGLLLMAMAPPLGRMLEARMLTHMLVQLPALFLAGVLSVAPQSTARCGRRWPFGAIPGLLFVSLVLAFWMLPIALDHAVADPAWDAAKAASLVLAGVVGRACWTMAPAVIQAFFFGNGAWMLATTGLLYQDAGMRLCNAYLQDDQSMTGTALVWSAVTISCVWILHLAAKSHRDAARESISKAGARTTEIAVATRDRQRTVS